MSARTPLRGVLRAFCALVLLAGMSWPTAAGDAKPLTAILLVARTGLPDPNFRDSVVLVTNSIGAVPAGVIVNRPTKMAVSDLFPDLGHLAGLEHRIYFGGPVHIATVSFLVRAATPPGNSTRVMDDVYLSSDRTLLRKLLDRDKPMDGLRIFIGYAGWSPGQLEAEVARGDWTLAPARADAVFGRGPEHPWPGPVAPDTARRI